MRPGRSLAVVLATTLAISALSYSAAQAVGGSAPVTDTSYSFITKIDVATDRSCTGILLDPHWVATAATCLPGAQPPVAGYPAQPITVTVGRFDLTSSTGQVRTALSVVPHPTRNLTLIRLATPATAAVPARIGSAAVAGEQLQALGYGRTATEWVPNALRSGTFTVESVGAGSLGIDGSGTGATLCKGDAGGPLVRRSGNVVEVVALHDRSWQGGCLGETETRRTAVETRLDDVAGWITSAIAAAPDWLADKPIPIMNGGRGLCLQTSATTNGSPVATATCSDAQDRQWTLVPQPDGWFQLKNAKTGKCLYGEQTAQSDVKTWNCDAGTNQQWQIDTVSFRSQLRNRASNLCVASPASTPNDVRMDPCGTWQDHYWVQRGHGGGLHGPIRAESVSRCLHGPGFISRGGLDLGSCDSAPPRWVQNGTTLRVGELCLTATTSPKAPAGSPADTTRAVACNGSSDQDWIPLPDGTIKSPVHNGCLTPVYSSLEFGGYIAKLATCDGQRWTIG